MAAAHKHTSGRCELHGKNSYSSRNRAKAAIRELKSPGMREYQCSRDTRYWHIGHLPPAVRDGKHTAVEHYATKEHQEADVKAATLTFQPSPADIKPLNGKRPVSLVAAEPVDNSIESLLTLAQASDNPSAAKLAERIRELIAELVDLIHTSKRERELRDLVAERRRLLDEAIRELSELNGKAPYLLRRPENLPPVSDQGAIRAWARENGHAVKSTGQVSLALRKAYEQAMAGGR